MSIDYGRFERFLSRCNEVVAEPGMNPIVVAVYNDALKGPSQAFLAASAKVASATIAFGKENNEALQALATLDAPYRVARAAVKTVHPETLGALPDTLKSLPVDTDKMNAIAGLLDIIDDYAGESWAAALLSGEFGTKAAAALKEIAEAIAANKGLSAAEIERATAYGPAYEKYVAFKRVVRNALGPASKQYRRIHMRASPGAAGDAGGEGDAAPPKPSGGEAGSPAAEPPAGGAAEPK